MKAGAWIIAGLCAGLGIALTLTSDLPTRVAELGPPVYDGATFAERWPARWRGFRHYRFRSGHAYDYSPSILCHVISYAGTPVLCLPWPQKDGFPQHWERTGHG